MQHGQVGEQVELLEYHADLTPHSLDVAHVVRELDAVDDDRAALVFLQAVERADEGGFAGPRWSEDHHHFAGHHFHADAFQRLEVIEPLVHVTGDDDGLVVLGLFVHSCLNFSARPHPELSLIAGWHKT